MARPWCATETARQSAFLREVAERQACSDSRQALAHRLNCIPDQTEHHGREQFFPRLRFVQQSFLASTRWQLSPDISCFPDIPYIGLCLRNWRPNDGRRLLAAKCLPSPPRTAERP